MANLAIIGKNRDNQLPKYHCCTSSPKPKLIALTPSPLPVDVDMLLVFQSSTCTCVLGIQPTLHVARWTQFQYMAKSDFFCMYWHFLSISTIFISLICLFLWKYLVVHVPQKPMHIKCVFLKLDKFQWPECYKLFILWRKFRFGRHVVCSRILQISNLN